MTALIAASQSLFSFTLRSDRPNADRELMMETAGVLALSVLAC